jgi:hypothetical protein
MVDLVFVVGEVIAALAAGVASFLFPAPENV